LLYADLFQPWVDRDNFDRTVTGLRQSLREGVMANRTLLRPGEEGRLKRVCSFVDVAFFAPVVYRVRTSDLDSSRERRDRGSALIGSDEILEVLSESEFDLLCIDAVLHPAHFDPDVAEVASADMQSGAVLSLLERRCPS
jgi:hypothetical protein